MLPLNPKALVPKTSKKKGPLVSSRPVFFDPCQVVFTLGRHGGSEVRCFCTAVPQQRSANHSSLERPFLAEALQSGARFFIFPLVATAFCNRWSLILHFPFVFSHFCDRLSWLTILVRGSSSWCSATWRCSMRRMNTLGMAQVTLSWMLWIGGFVV